MKNRSNALRRSPQSLPHDMKFREQPPRVNPTKEGVEVLCPFCNPTHTILPGVEAACGTSLKVTAVQLVYTSHYTRFNKIACLKCHQTGGEMVKLNNGFVHLADCAPGLKILTTPPKLSRTAKLVIRLPIKLRALVEKRTGIAKELHEIDKNGQDTGKVRGYFFWKGVSDAS